MTYPVISLQKGREAATGFHHPWIFSGALQPVSGKIKHGDLVHVEDRQGKIIGTGTYSAHTSIAVRLFAFKEVEINESWLTASIRQASDRRLLLGLGGNMSTTGYRVIFGEVDELPGLVVDRYDDVLVMQISTAGMDNLRTSVLAALKSVFSPRVVVERSDMLIRRKEKLVEQVLVHYGQVKEPVIFLENNLKFQADVLTGQKTGFYLDQRELRAKIGQFSTDRTILNLFSYTGATAVVAVKNGATRVHNVDSSASALKLCHKQLQLNGLSASTVTTEAADVFSWLDQNQDQKYDLVIVDPPALTKSKRDKDAAAKAYHFLNRAALRLLNSGGILVSSSCSRFFSEDDLAFMLRRASVQAGVNLHLLASLRQAFDHPLSVYFPESLYLKSYIGVIDD